MTNYVEPTNKAKPTCRSVYLVLGACLLGLILYVLLTSTLTGDRPYGTLTATMPDGTERIIRIYPEEPSAEWDRSVKQAVDTALPEESLEEGLLEQLGSVRFDFVHTQRDKSIEHELSQNLSNASFSVNRTSEIYVRYFIKVNDSADEYPYSIMRAQGKPGDVVVYDFASFNDLGIANTLMVDLINNQIKTFRPFLEVGDK